jgi:hypothetical protein
MTLALVSCSSLLVSAALAAAAPTFDGHVDAQPVPAQQHHRTAQVADLNGDGLDDLLVTRGSQTTDQYRATPSGAFEAMLGMSFVIGDTRDFVLADFNDDHRPDILSRAGTVHFNDGTGANFPTSAPIGPVGNVLAADLNDDGRPEAIIFTGPELLVLLCTGPAQFAPAIIHNLSAFGLSAADLDLRPVVARPAGAPELIVGNVRIRAPLNPAVPAQLITFRDLDGSESSQARAIASADLDGDGREELLVDTRLSPNNRWAFTLGALSFAHADMPVRIFNTSLRIQGPYNLTLTDLDGDTDLDAVAWSRTISVNYGSTTWEHAPSIAVFTNPGDGTLELGPLLSSGGINLQAAAVGQFAAGGQHQLLLYNAGVMLQEGASGADRLSDWGNTRCAGRRPLLSFLRY